MDALGAGFSAGLRRLLLCSLQRLSAVNQQSPLPAASRAGRPARGRAGSWTHAVRLWPLLFHPDRSSGGGANPCLREAERERERRGQRGPHQGGRWEPQGAGSVCGRRCQRPCRTLVLVSFRERAPALAAPGGWLRASGLLRPSWPGPCRVLGLGHQGGAAATPLPHAREVVGPPSLSRMLRDAGQPRGKKSEHVGASAPTQRRRFLWWLTSSTLGPRRVRDYRAPEPRHSRAESVEGPLRAGLCGL